MTVSHRDVLRYIRLAGCYAGHLESRLVNDITQVLQLYKTLTINVDIFTNDAGITQRLVYIGGTIPISYKGAAYNIPVRIWMMTYHPAGPPVVFVRTSASLQLRDRHEHVDERGKVYLPELHSWNASQSSIPQVIAKMIAVFSKVPPLYAKASRPRVARSEQERRGMVESLSNRLRMSLEAKSRDGRKQYAVLQKELAEVVDGEDALRDAKSQVSEAVKANVEAISVIRAKHKTLLDDLERRNMNSDLDLDKVITPDALTAQVVTCVAKDQAYQEALDVVGEALGTETIDMDKFLKETRRLAVELFMTRALKMKVRRRQRELQASGSPSR